MGKTITEKIFDAHCIDQPTPDNYVLRLDAVLCHEITTPIAITDLMERSMDRVFDPARIKAVIDHVTPAKDSKTATQGKIMRDWARRQNIHDFFDIGANGVCHALFPEKGFIRPGYTVIMGDSHTCTHGAFGAFAAGVGTTDLEVGILKGVCSFRKPRTMKVEITGDLPSAVTAKDIILHVIGTITVNGATDMVMEFVGDTVAKMTMDERMTLCNMAIEAGATCGVCLPDRTTAEYLWPFIKEEYTSVDAAAADFAGLHSDADAVYAAAISVDASALSPQVTFGFKPDQVKAAAKMSDTAVDQVYIGSCTNGRLSDLRQAATILAGRKLARGVRGVVSPATPHIYSQAMEEGILKTFLDAGFCVINPTCGPCLGMSCGVLAEGESCASTTNRNFNGRMGKGGMVHLMSPYTAAATAVTGHITDPSLFL